MLSINNPSYVEDIITPLKNENDKSGLKRIQYLELKADRQRFVIWAELCVCHQIAPAFWF